MARRRNRLVVPEAREGVGRLQTEALRREGYGNGRNQGNEMKYSVADQLGVPLEPGYNGNLPTSEAGKIGGVIGGLTVRELVRLGQQQLAESKPADRVNQRR